MISVLEREEELIMTPKAARVIEELNEAKENAIRNGENPIHKMLHLWGGYITSPQYDFFGTDDKEYIIRHISKQHLEIKSCN